jgi:hypothetical protein
MIAATIHKIVSCFCRRLAAYWVLGIGYWLLVAGRSEAEIPQQAGLLVADRS